MELHDAPATYLFKLWPWLEANRIRIIWVSGVIVVAAGVISFYSWQRGQNEITAGKALTQMMSSIPRNATASQQADLYLKIAADYPGTPAGQRALLQAAATLFAAGKYADAQAQFQKFLDAHPGQFLCRPGRARRGGEPGRPGQNGSGRQRLSADHQQPLPTRQRWTAAKFALAQIDERRANLPMRQIFTEDRARQSQQFAGFGSRIALDGIEK